MVSFEEVMGEDDADNPAPGTAPDFGAVYPWGPPRILRFGPKGYYVHRLSRLVPAMLGHAAIGRSSGNPFDPKETTA